MRYSMVINLNKCVGCWACVMKCKQEHFLPPGMTWAKLLFSESGTGSEVRKHVYPVVSNSGWENPARFNLFYNCEKNLIRR